MKIDFDKNSIVGMLRFFRSPEKSNYLVRRDADGHYNIMDSKGNLKLAHWYKKITINRGYGDVQKAIGIVMRMDGLVNLITEDGEILCRDWFNGVASDFENGLIEVYVEKRKKTVVNLVKYDGSYVQEEWFTEEEIPHMRNKYERRRAG